MTNEHLAGTIADYNRRTITVGQLKEPVAIDSMIYHNEGFKFLRALRGSPLYFKNRYAQCVHASALRYGALVINYSKTANGHDTKTILVNFKKKKFKNYK